MDKNRNIKDVFTTSFTIKFILILINVIASFVVLTEINFKGVLLNIVSLLAMYLIVYFIHSFLFYELIKKIKTRFKDRNIECELTLYEFIDDQVLLSSNIFAIQYFLFELVMILTTKKFILAQILILTN